MSCVNIKISHFSKQLKLITYLCNEDILLGRRYIFKYNSDAFHSPSVNDPALSADIVCW